jgi:hypothetical protein
LFLDNIGQVYIKLNSIAHPDIAKHSCGRTAMTGNGWAAKLRGHPALATGQSGF